MSESKWKEDFFNSLFEKQVKRLPYSKNEKYVDISIKIKNKALENFFNEQYLKYKNINKSHSYQDIINYCIYLSFLAINSFKIKDDGSWEGIIKGTDKKNIGKLITCIMKTVKYELIRFINDHMTYTTAKIEGKNQHVRVKFEISSLDKLLIGLDGSTIDMLSTLDNESNFWTVRQKYQLDCFYKWFHDRRKDKIIGNKVIKKGILTKNQNQLLDKMAKLQNEHDDYTENDFKSVFGYDRGKANQRINQDIKPRVLRAWEAENPLGFKSYLLMQKEFEIQFWEKLIDLIYNENIDYKYQNEAISNWIVKNLDNEIVSNLIYDNFFGEDCEKITSAFKHNDKLIPNKILYKIINLVENRLEKLRLFNTKTTKFFKTKHEMGNWNKEAHDTYHKNIKHFKQQNCYIYDTTGKHVRTEKWKPFKESESIIMNVLPSGFVYFTNRMKAD
jgi:hypothetical protein